MGVFFCGISFIRSSPFGAQIRFSQRGQGSFSRYLYERLTCAASARQRFFHPYHTYTDRHLAFLWTKGTKEKDKHANC